MNTTDQTILLRSGWQWVNIGDIAHTPGMLCLMKQYLPDARVILWHNQLGDRTERMLLRHFPRLEFLQADGVEELALEVSPPARVPSGRSVTPPEQPAVLRRVTLDEAVESADFCLHGSGPSLVGERQIRDWTLRTTKPFGAIGITVQAPPPATIELLQKAMFVFTRETHSLDHMRRAGLTKPRVGFVPDVTFACTIRDDATADEYLQKVGLLGKRFICVIPRLRRSPYYKIYPNTPWRPEDIAATEAFNQQHAEPDHAKLREVMIRYVRSTGGSVLVCPEMEYELAIQKPLLIDPLPDDVKAHVINRDTYWLTDEAASVYRHAQGLIGCECHSPILCAVQGVTGFYVRQPEDTIKGQMWYDLGLDDRVAEIMDITGEQLAEKFMKLINHPANAAATLHGAMTMARTAHALAFTELRNVLSRD